MGGDSSYTLGACPASAEDAAKLLKTHRKQDRAASGTAMVSETRVPASGDTDSSSSPMNMMMLVSCLLAGGALIGGIAFAAQRRPDRISTPLMSNERDASPVE